MADYFDTGFCVRTASWHRKENLLDRYPDSWDEARKFAGLEWEPTYQDLFMPEVVPLVMFEDPDYQLPIGAIEVARDDFGVTLHVPVGGHQAIVRSDNRHVLSVPRDSWKLITHATMGDLLEAFTDAWRKAGAKVLFETAGSVHEGAKVWALVRLDEPYTIPGDTSATYPYGVLLNAHDGSAACTLKRTQVRVVCANTWAAADYSDDPEQIVLRHAGKVDERIEDAKATLRTMRDAALGWQEAAGHLATININDAVVRTFLDEFIPLPDGPVSDRTRNNRAARQQAFISLYEDSPTCADLPETAYRLVQCAGEYLDHLRPYRNADTYLARTLLRPEPIKAKTIQLVQEIARELMPA